MLICCALLASQTNAVQPLSCGFGTRRLRRFTVAPSTARVEFQPQFWKNGFLGQSLAKCAEWNELPIKKPRRKNSEPPNRILGRGEVNRVGVQLVLGDHDFGKFDGVLVAAFDGQRSKFVGGEFAFFGA